MRTVCLHSNLHTFFVLNPEPFLCFDSDEWPHNTFAAITIQNTLFFIISPSTMFLLVRFPTHKYTNCSTIHNQSGSFINNRMCHSSSKHALPFENPQLGQECKVDKSQAHQHILQRVQHRSHITKHDNKSDSNDKERKILQSNSSKGQQRVVRSDDHAESRHEGKDVDGERPG